MTDPALAAVREAVDALDVEIVGLIADRQRWVERAAAVKAGRGTDAVRAPARVEQVVAKVRGLAQEQGASPVVVEATYRAMIAAFIELELAEHGAHD